MADKIVVLRDGKVEQHGTPMQLYADPDNLFVAGFIGSPRMNFLDARVCEGGQVAFNAFPEVTFRPTTTSELPVGSTVTVGLRPEHFQPQGPVKLSVPVDVVENLGSVSYAYGRAAENENPLIVEWRDAAPAQGVIPAAFDPADALLFNRETGLRIR